MEELLKINEEYLAKLKYAPLSEYFGWPMAAIFGEIVSNVDKLGGAEFYSVCRNFLHRFIGINYIEIRMPDYSIIVFRIDGNARVLEKRLFSFDERELDSVYFK